MPELLCPVCGKPLRREAARRVCENNHSFDRAASGYVNLLISKQNGNQHGDDRAMVRARRDFLDTGSYAPLRDRICRRVLENLPPDSAEILDAGCGECYYTAGVESFLRAAGREPRIIGIDISRDALKIGGRRSPSLELAVASVFRLPVGNNSCDLLLNIFAPFAGEEYRRVLKPGGVLLHVCPDTDHLWELKEAVYEKPYKNDAAPAAAPGLEVMDEERISYSLPLHRGEDIQALFQMTPYAHKTSPRDMARLERLENLTVSAQFILRLYRKS